MPWRRRPRGWEGAAAGTASGGCGGLGLGLGPGGDAVRHPGVPPPVRRLGVEAPEFLQRRPGRRPHPGLPHPLNPPEAQPLPAVGDESPVGGPPLFPLGGEDVGLRQLKNLHPPFGGGGARPPTAYSPAPATHVATPTTPRPPPSAGACPGRQPPPPRQLIPTAPPPTAGGAPAPTKTGESIPDSPGRRGGGGPGLGGGGQQGLPGPMAGPGGPPQPSTPSTP